jgi:succinate dehydrogenase / fumarate reductase, flavoprotein subunit
VDSDAVHAAVNAALTPFAEEGGENPYDVQRELQEVMHTLVGIIRNASELEQAMLEIEKLAERADHLTVTGNRRYNPGWHLALDLQNMLWVSECIARAALTRTESRGGHTRDDYPMTDDDWGTKNIVLRERAGAIDLAIQSLSEMPDDLNTLFAQS